MAERKADPTDDARVAAKWLGVWEEGKRCHGGSHEVEWHETLNRHGGLSHGFTAPTGSKIACIHGEMDAHDIPPPDFDDPVVYDRALRELTPRGHLWRIYPMPESEAEPFRLDIYALNERRETLTYQGGGPTIGAAIAVAIAELARAESGKAVGA